jgi:Domain of unknown function (DUF5069)
MTFNAPDLTQHPPRSPRVRLGGYVILPRCLDKCRASITGKNGEYHYACPMDHRFLDFTGIDAEELKKEVATGKSDGEILEWIEKSARFRRTPVEIANWSTYAEQRVPGDTETRDFLNGVCSKIAPKREDIFTFFDMLDVDDYVTFGGKP